MTLFVARFGTPEDVTRPGFDGKSIRFPYVVIDREHIDTPRQNSKTIHGRITVEISGSLLDGSWRLPAEHLNKVLFQFAREHLDTLLAKSGSGAGDTSIRVDNYNQPNVCPFDVSLIPEPDGAFVEVEVSRPIGFV